MDSRLRFLQDGPVTLVTMRKVIVGAVLVASLGLVATGGLVACAASSDYVSGDILTETLPQDVTAQGVLLAAVILSSGDINSAVDKGIVTGAEVTQARDAILANTLDLWRQRAETEVKASGQ